MIDFATKLFGLSGLTDLNANMRASDKGEGQELVIEGKFARERQKCSQCGSSDTTFKQKKVRRFLLPPIGGTRVTLAIQVKKCRCKECKHIWWPVMPFAEGKQRFTQAFTTYATGLLRFATVNDVAKHLGVGWDSIKAMHKKQLQEKYKKIDISDIEYMSVDEIAIRKGHSYMTIFSDALSGRIVHAVKGKKKKDVIPFLKDVKKKPSILRPLQWTCANPTYQPCERNSLA